MKTLTLLFFATLAIAQTPHQQDSTTGRTGSVQDFSGAKGKPPETIVGSLPTAASNTNFVYLVTDGASASDCATGSGSTRVWCTSNGAAWVAVGGAAGGSGFGTTACTTPSGAGSSGAVTLSFTAPVNCNLVSISVATTVTLPTPASNAAGPVLLRVQNVTPTASPFTYAGAAQTNLAQPTSEAANTVTEIWMYWTGTAWEPAAPATDITATVAAAGSALCSNYPTGPPIACVANTTIAVTGATQNANTCTTPATATMTGLTTSMVALAGYSANPTSLTGWGSTGGMVFQSWPSSSNTLSWQVCNQTTSNITFSSITFNVGAR